MNLAIVFPGQGSQSVGMLRAYADDAAVGAVRSAAAAALSDAFVTLLDEGPAEALALTVNTQPAMLAAGVAAYRAWRAAGGPVPRMVAGHSLGEYSALVAAEALRLEDALPLVRLRAEAMQAAVPKGEGAMAAILNLDDDAVRAACAEAAQGEVVEAVNFNAPGQVVIAGHAAAVARAIDACKARGARRAMLLPVSAPFHSSLMQPAARQLSAALEKTQFVQPGIEVIHNVDARAATGPAEIRKALERQAAAPVQWVETVRAMSASGITHVVECGPGKVLAGLARRIAPDLKSFAVFDSASLHQTLDELAGSSDGT